MKYTKKAVLIFMLLTLSVFTPVLAKKSDIYVAKIPYRFDAKPSWAVKPDKNTATVEILNIPTGETVSQSVTVIAEVKGATQVLLAGTPMTEVGYGDRYYGTWTTITTGPSVIEVTAQDSEDNTIADTVTVNVVDAPQWTIYLEIDYMEGHEPSEFTLNYLKEYWAGFAITVQYLHGELVTDPTNDGHISDQDFWALEKAHNDAYEVNDKASDGVDSDLFGYDAEYMSQEKWILWGSEDTNPYVGGYTYVVIDKKDALAGNYIFIADGMIDSWEARYGMGDDNGDIIVLCHELGHSIGILQLRGNTEKYDPDYYSIMSTMRPENADYMQDAWYYSSTYWNSKNLEYYE